MKKQKTKVGYIAYQTTREEICRLGGLGICDTCNSPEGNGYLVPILNRWLCPRCYEKWEVEAVYYAEDIHIEQKNLKYYESIIPLTDSNEKAQQGGHLKPFRILGITPKGTCTECATKHAPEQPHNQQSLTYQYKFYDKHGRWPTWADAMKHCPEEIKNYWVEALKEHGIEVTA